jgi:hypothetical protein
MMGRASLTQGTAMLKRSVLFAAALLAAASWTAAAAPAAPRAAGVTQFDGTWSVSIVTDSGECDRGYRYALRIAGGRIYYDNPSFDISGQVNAGGYVRVVVRAGSQEASGTGRLSRDYGTGSWSGHSPTSRCSGHWEAERRAGGD